MASIHEFSAMRRAIAISAQGLGSTSPNPPVGCVILDREGRTVGEGFHVRKGESHAEVNALTAAGKCAAGGTAVVTLEPCNHHGRTPPCREALVNANVARVLIAVMDPTSRGEGGAALLQKAGIDVEQDFLRNEALLVLAPWLDSVRIGHPFVTWIYEAGPDGSPFTPDRFGVVHNEARALRESYDLILRQDGKVQEGNSESHGAGVFQVPSILTGAVSEIIDKLSDSGARSILVEGESDIAESLAAAGVIDRVIVYLPNVAHSWAPKERSSRVTAIPDGYRLTSVSRLRDHVRLVGHKN